ncbi:MAG: class I SAM-dependent methyltransferase [Candidatus Colwellbacteria bacterium]|nr:class I SAM-dependent methyltransferase [Candidatus Colwellbacteria bacterium]
MDLRKEREINHYDKLARGWQAKVTVHPKLALLDIEAINVMRMSSYQFLYKLLKRYVPGKKVLDYGCGHGMHSIQIAKMGAKEVIGIDLSEESLKIAEERRMKYEVSNVRFTKMDAEALEFPDNFFDIVFDGGTFSSIELEKGLQEIHHILKPGGLLIGIETLGHHPLANLKRWLNKKRGVRTFWAAAHIMKMGDLGLAKKYLDLEQIHFFHFVSLLTIPLQRLPGSRAACRIANGIDKILFKIFPSLKKYAFKAVFVFSKNAKPQGD